METLPSHFHGHLTERSSWKTHAVSQLCLWRGFHLVLPSGSLSCDGACLRPERILAAALQRWQDDI